MLRQLTLSMAMTAAAILCQAALAQDFPTRAVRIIVPWPPSGNVDITARTVAPALAEALGQPVIVENRPGAGTNIANEFVARSAPDVRQRLLDQGAQPVGNTPEEFSRQLHAEVGTWAEVVKLSGAKADE